jgi:hypothetical protein
MKIASVIGLSGSVIRALLCRVPKQPRLPPRERPPWGDPAAAGRYAMSAASVGCVDAM